MSFSAGVTTWLKQGVAVTEEEDAFYCYLYIPQWVCVNFHPEPFVLQPVRPTLYRRTGHHSTVTIQ